MPQLSESMMSLRISGEALIPDDITRLLGAPPTHSLKKGDVKYRSKDGRETIAKAGTWQLTAAIRTPEDTDGQVAEILGKLTDDMSVWTSLSQQFQVDLYCGWFMTDTNEGVSISPQTLAALGARGIEFGVDIYAPLKKVTPSETDHASEDGQAES